MLATVFPPFINLRRTHQNCNQNYVLLKTNPESKKDTGM